MQQLEIPDLCAHLDRLRSLCDRLESAQGEPAKYEGLVAAIRAEADALTATLCRISDTKDANDDNALTQ